MSITSPFLIYWQSPNLALTRGEHPTIISPPLYTNYILYLYLSQTSSILILTLPFSIAIRTASGTIPARILGTLINVSSSVMHEALLEHATFDVACQMSLFSQERILVVSCRMTLFASLTIWV